MRTNRFSTKVLAWLALASLMGVAAHAQQADPLPSWAEGPTKSAITQFVQDVTDEASDDFVPPKERVAVFDNDGTLWVEQPVYTQLVFAFDRVKELAPRHPDWKSQQPFKAVLEGDKEAIVASGMKGVLEIVLATHSGMTAEKFYSEVLDWLATAKHPRFKRLYTELVYQPQLELLAYLRANGFKTFIVSGGGISFMRPWTDRVYGVPPEQVVGSSLASEFEVRDGEPVIVREPKMQFIDDKAGKPIGIYEHIGRRPIFAFGNSDGDLEMLEFTLGGQGRSAAFILHHTDAEREYAYDRDTHVGRLSKGLDEAQAEGWVIVDMKREWKTVFPPAKR